MPSKDAFGAGRMARPATNPLEPLRLLGPHALGGKIKSLCHLNQTKPGETYSPFAHARPSAFLPTSMSVDTSHFFRSITPIFALKSHETYATAPSGRTRISCGARGS